MAFVFPAHELQPSLGQAFKLAGFVAFLAAATLFIGFNHKIFEVVLGEKSKTYWWLIACILIVPFLLILYVFSVLFGNIFT